MSKAVYDEFIQELDRIIGDRPFYTLRELIAIGFFGSRSAARNALKEGLLTFVKISPRRFVIPRKAVLYYLHSKISPSHSTVAPTQEKHIKSKATKKEASVNDNRK